VLCFVSGYAAQEYQSHSENFMKNFETSCPFFRGVDIMYQRDRSYADDFDRSLTSVRSAVFEQLRMLTCASARGGGSHEHGGLSQNDLVPNIDHTKGRERSV